MDPTKTLVDQIREIDKLICDGLDRLAQAQFALQSLQRRLEQQQAHDATELLARR
jgi:hypothetical protein